MKFRKKPVVIEATQWFKNGDHPDDFLKDMDGLEDGKPKIFSGAYRKERNWEGDVVRYYRTPSLDGQDKCKHCGRIMHDHGWIDTLEGGHIVCPGDWIITGVSDEKYPCKPDIFAKTYEAVETESNVSDEEKKTLLLGLLRSANGPRKVAFAANNPFRVDPVRVARELKAWCPADQLPLVLQYLYVEVHDVYNEPAFKSYFE